jgi:hypothetical protein
MPKRSFESDFCNVHVIEKSRPDSDAKFLTLAIHPDHRLIVCEYSAFTPEFFISFAQSEPKLTFSLSFCVRRAPLVFFQTSATWACGACLSKKSWQTVHTSRDDATAKSVMEFSLAHKTHDTSAW